MVFDWMVSTVYTCCACVYRDACLIVRGFFVDVVDVVEMVCGYSARFFAPNEDGFACVNSVAQCETYVIAVWVGAIVLEARL